MGLIYIDPHYLIHTSWIEKLKKKSRKHNSGSNYISFTYLENQCSIGDRAVHGQTLNCNAHSLIMQWMVFPCNASPEAALLAVCWCEGYTVRGYMRFSEVTTCNSSFIPSLFLLKPAALLRNTNDLRFPRGNRAGLMGKMRKAGIQRCVRHRRMCVCVWLECEWAWHRVWEMRMFHTMTTNVPIHYCFTSFICSVSIVWACLPRSLHICGLIGTDVSAVRSISSSACTTWPVKHADVTWVHVWVAMWRGLPHISTVKVEIW